jgi:ABC-type nitrate/sulfonate/bicarbonate transport system substrate-binding protein
VRISRRSAVRAVGRAATVALLAGCAPVLIRPVAVPTSPPATPHTEGPGGLATSGTATVAGLGSTVPWRFALPRNLNGSPIMVGLENGIFVKYGLDAKISTVDAAAAQIKAVQVGDADLASAAIGSFIASREQDVPVRGYGILLGDSRLLNPDPMLSIVASAGSGIASPADLRGKTVGAQAGTTLETYLRKVLAAYGIPLDAIQLVNVNQVNTAQALVQGVDAVATVEPYGELTLASVPGCQVILRGGGYVAQRVVIVAHHDVARRHGGDVFERALTGVFESMRYARLHLDETADITTRWLGGNLDPEILRKGIHQYVYDPRISPMVEASWESETKTLIEQKKLRQPTPFAEGFDATLAVKILQARPDLIADLS